MYTFDLFTQIFRDMFLREFDAFEQTDLPRRRPNTMNAAGLIVNEIGMHALMSDLLRVVVSPIAAALCGATGARVMRTAATTTFSPQTWTTTTVSWFTTRRGGRSRPRHAPRRERVTLNVAWGAMISREPVFDSAVVSEAPIIVRRRACYPTRLEEP